ncbi:MAG TPA: hypothetical protein DER09_02965 [Prolixibacteraceae bacterium]|nr:hypothetical protein [Prolixibacteraceae bacterium]
MKQLIIIITLFSASFIHFGLFAQNFSVEMQIQNQPSGIVIFGAVRGDDFIRIDSIQVSESTARVKFVFPENAHAGMYRIILGNTSYEKIMNKPPHQLDFIFDNENIVFEADFEATEEKLKIKQSKENIAWYSFRATDRELMEKISILESDVDKSRKTSDAVKINDLANQYNQMQMERDMFVVKASQESRGLFVSQVIKNQRLPMLDGYLSPEERLNAFKSDYFKVLDFSNPGLINSQVYTDNIFNYLTRYNSPFITQKQREAAYIKAVDFIMLNVKQNNEVRKFIKDYLLHGFEVLKLNSLVSYIEKKYPQ